MPDKDLLTAISWQEGGIAGSNPASLSPDGYLPHAAPVLVLKEIVHARPASLLARGQLDKRSPFYVADQGVPYWCCLEFMSQAIAALQGIRASLKGQPPPIGYLLGTKCLSSDSEFLPLDTVFDVAVEEVVQHENGLAYFNGELTWSDNAIRCQLSVFRRSK